MGGMGHIKHHAQTALDAGHMVGSKLAQLVARRTLVHIHLTNQVG